MKPAMPVSLTPNSDESTSHSAKPASGQVAGYLPQAGERDAVSLREFLVNAQAVFVHADQDELSTAVALRVAELAAEAIAARGVFHVALAGGETARRFHEKLRDCSIDWVHVQVYFGDERCLPDGDAQRNDRMAFDTLLRHIAIPPVNIHTIPAELGACVAAVRYAVVLAGIERLDLALLGMGEDGHTASLFPGNPAAASAAAVVPVFDAPKLPAERVSLGMGTLNAARHKIFLVAGAGKREALERITSGEILPAAAIVSAEWHLDRAAVPG